jgi:hypothetical protein
MTGLPMTLPSAIDLAIGIMTKNPDLMTGLASDVLYEQVQTLDPAERIDVIADTLQRAVFELIMFRGQLAAGRVSIDPL